MKETGIVRRVDDLGRVVIPKELRYKLGIKEGDALEILYDDETICFKKYNAEGLFCSALNKVVDMLNDTDVSQCLSPEEKTLITSMVNLLSKKWKGGNDAE